VQANEEWLSAAKSGIEFLRAHASNDEGRMYFTVTRQGEPLRLRRYVFSEMFAAIANASFAKASGDSQSAEDAVMWFERATKAITTDGLLPSKVDPATRSARGFGAPMIILNSAQELRDTIGYEKADEWIDWSIDQIRQYFLNEQYRAVMEMVALDGSLIDHYDGRLLNPGHALEGAWFVLREAEFRGDSELQSLGLKMLDWMWQWGWDEEHGGITYFRDVRDLPVQEYWHDMKFWWPQNEAIIATLYGYKLSGNEKYAKWHKAIHDWTHNHFPDREHGEWYGYLHRDGKVSQPSKGTMWKGPFHIPRMQLVCWELTRELLDQSNNTVEPDND